MFFRTIVTVSLSRAPRGFAEVFPSRHRSTETGGEVYRATALIERVILA
jgi:hypothetical protein